MASNAFMNTKWIYVVNMVLGGGLFTLAEKFIHGFTAWPFVVLVFGSGAILAFAYTLILQEKANPLGVVAIVFLGEIVVWDPVIIYFTSLGSFFALLPLGLFAVGWIFIILMVERYDG